MNTEDELELKAILKSADGDDLATLVNIITDNGKGRVSLKGDICQTLHEAQRKPAQLHRHANLIAEEIRLFGGNTIANFFRGGKGVDYAEILRDVADHLNVSYNDTTHSTVIEMQILIKILEKSMDEMTPEQRDELIRELSGGTIKGAGPGGMAALIAMVNMGGFASYRIALIVANTVARQLTGKGLQLAANAGIARALGTFAGPIGWAITVLWTAYDLAAPAYRVTVPAVVMIAYMRQKKLAETAHCPNPDCQHPIVGTPKFCPECGTRLQEGK